jgi:hypothetical protein
VPPLFTDNSEEDYLGYRSYLSRDLMIEGMIYELCAYIEELVQYLVTVLPYYAKTA